MKKRKLAYLLILLGYTFLLYEWFVLYYSFLRAFINGGWIILHVNMSNEAFFEFSIFPIFTILAILGYIYMVKVIVYKEKLKDKPSMFDEFTEWYVNVSKFRKSGYFEFLMLGMFLGFFISEIVVRALGHISIYYMGYQIHHLYVGIVGFLIFFIPYWRIKKLSLNTCIILTILFSISFGVALHDLYYHIFFYPFKITA